MKVLVNIRSHICFQHMFLHSSFADQKMFNVSADCEVNSYIENLPKGACTSEWLSTKIGKPLEKGIGTKKYYEAIQDFLNQQQSQAQNPQMPCNGGQGGSSQSNQQNSPSNPQSPQREQQNDSNKTPQSSSSPSEATQDTSLQKEKEQPSPTQENQKSQPDTQDRNYDSQEQTQGQQERGSEKMEDSQEEQSQGKEEQQGSQYPEEIEKYFNPVDDHSTWDVFNDIPEATKQLMQNNINTILKNTAEQVEKMSGTIPGEFAELIEKLRTKKPEVFNWKAYFRRLLGSIYDVNIRSTRRKESKRFAEATGIQHKKKVSILVAVDTSGSVSKEELQEFFSEIDYAFKAGARITILQCDTSINAIEDYDGKNIPEIKGRGGTDFNPPVDYYVKHKKDYASLIYFTDGEALLPNKTPQGMVWVISSRGYHQEYPGKVIYIPPKVNN